MHKYMLVLLGNPLKWENAKWKVNNNYNFRWNIEIYL